MIDTRRPEPNEIPPEACMRFTLPASSVRTLPGGKALVLVPLVAAPAFVRTLILNLQQMGMWPAEVDQVEKDRNWAAEVSRLATELKAYHDKDPVVIAQRAAAKAVYEADLPPAGQGLTLGPA